jgi:hypothetical protein
LFFFGQFFLNTEVAQILGHPFSTVKVMYVLVFTKNGLGNILGDFLTNSSGHTNNNEQQR